MLSMSTETMNMAIKDPVYIKTKAAPKPKVVVDLTSDTEEEQGCTSIAAEGSRERGDATNTENGGGANGRAADFLVTRNITVDSSNAESDMTNIEQEKTKAHLTKDDGKQYEKARSPKEDGKENEKADLPNNNSKENETARLGHDANTHANMGTDTDADMEKHGSAGTAGEAVRESAGSNT